MAAIWRWPSRLHWYQLKPSFRLIVHRFSTTGERFAMAEMKMALAKVVSKFRVEPDETTKIEFQKGDQAMMSYHGVYVRMVPR